MNVTFFGDLAVEFANSVKAIKDDTITVIIASAKVNEYEGIIFVLELFKALLLSQLCFNLKAIIFITTVFHTSLCVTFRNNMLEQLSCDEVLS